LILAGVVAGVVTAPVSRGSRNGAWFCRAS
jgi:hypothetical protein